MTTTVTYHVSRDSAKDNLSDYDRAMCHASIHSGESFEAARDALVAYITGEADYALANKFTVTRASSLRRAADLLDTAECARRIAGVPTNKPWTKTTVVGAGIEYAIIRVEREVKTS